MKAVQIKKFGSIDAIEINDIKKPFIKRGQVEVEIFAAGLNPIDSKIRLGNLKGIIKSLPITLGTDFAGKISKVLEESNGFEVGDKVFGSAIILGGGSGALAEFAAVNIANIALKPSKLNYIQAASLPLAGASALQAIEEHIKIKKGQKIFISGGSGGIGSLAIQLSKMHGAYVASTASSESVEFVRSLGADEVIDYTKHHVERILKNYDAVFDTVGGEAAKKLLEVLKKGGILVSMAAEFDPELSRKYRVRTISQETKSTSEKFKRLADLADSGELKTEVYKVFPFGRIKQAFYYLENKHHKGKIVIDISG